MHYNFTNLNHFEVERTIVTFEKMTVRTVLSRKNDDKKIYFHIYSKSRLVFHFDPFRVIPKDVKRWELLLPCLAFNNKG